MTENNLPQEEAMAGMLPRPGLLTQDNPTLMGILTLGNKQSVELVASDYFAHHEVCVGLEFETSIKSVPIFSAIGFWRKKCN